MAKADQRLVSRDPTKPAGSQFSLGVRDEFAAIVTQEISAFDVPGRIVAAVAAASTVTDAAAAAIDGLVGPAVEDAITGILANPDSDLTNFLDVRYAPFSLAATIGNGTDTTYYVTHNAFDDILVQLKLVATGELIGAKVVALSEAVTQITFQNPPATNSIRVLLQPIGSLVAVEDTTPPTAPTSVVASGITGSSVTLTWDASTDAVGVVFYSVYRAPGSGASFGSATMIGSNGVTRAFADTTVAKATAYTYFVTATDFSLNESLPSTGINATTPAAVGTDPSTHLSLVSNFDAAHMGATYSDGAAIGSWSPTAGGSKTDPLVQATAASKPMFIANAVNSLPAADFDGGDLLKVDAASWSINKGVIYGVVRADTLASVGSAKNAMMYGTYGTGGSYRYIASLPSSLFGLGLGNSGGQATTTVMINTWYAVVAKFVGGTTGYKLWLNNITSVPTATSSAGVAMSGSVNSFWLGANAAGFFWDGRIAQAGVLSCDVTEVSDTECGEICRFLADKFAIAV